MDETTLTIDVSTPQQVMARTIAAFEGRADQTPRLTFQSYESLFRTLTPGRMGLLEALTGTGPLGVRELARRVGRDVKAVHTDTQALVACGALDKTPEGKLSFPYQRVRVDFTLEAAA